MSAPSTFTQQIADQICAAIMEGKSLRTACKAEGMPTKITVMRWLRVNEDFARQYALAAQERTDALVEEILDIADDGTNDWMEAHDGENAGYRFNGEGFSRSRLRIDTRKWIAGKMKPKKYGDFLRQDLTIRSAEDMSDEQLARIAAGGREFVAEAQASPENDD